MSRPRIDPAVAAALTSRVLPRLIKKLDAAPGLADAWTWTDDTVTTDRGETVTLVTGGGIVTDVTCSCLLAPRCLHVAAVIAALEPAASAATPEAGPPSPGLGPPPDPAGRPAAAHAEVARQAFRVVADVLASGAETTGAFAQAELLRSIHACRTAGLHRLATVQTRILRSVRELRADKPEFDLAVLTADLRDALDVAHALESGQGGDELVGTARRDYAPIGSLRLRGLFTEAVVAKSGYAGAVTYLVDDRGRMFSRADVAPGDAGRAAGAYDAPANIGDAVLPHRELCRAGLFVAEATASPDGRLGAGTKVRAVRAAEPSRWEAEPLASRWTEPLADQLARIAAQDATAEAARAAGWDLVFVDGTIVPGGLFALASGAVVRLTTPHDQRVLPARDNLAVLARSPGLQLRAIGRVRLGAPRQLELLAVAPRPGEERLVLADAWHGRANLHYDRLSLPAGAAALVTPPVPMVGAGDELLAPLRRRVERVVQGGVGTLPVHAIAELEREAAALAARSLRGAAEVMRDLAALAHDAGRTMSGVRRAIDRTSFARAWLRAALYEDAARRRLSIASW